ncbi:hypothetical protein ADUPG1_011810 [Aduncisulcus paluster]|uniref:Uncharacterized protein n=2 Tax=Aduncisulcus paluster TaxID=2918883 RepID=A0ABQ5K0J8_9EUKA|nr:hypothetical protein ADUPG1_011810 [Aduncisulcus paluster]
MNGLSTQPSLSLFEDSIGTTYVNVQNPATLDPDVFNTYFSLSVITFDIISGQSCDVSDKDMAALEERGVSAAEMESYYYQSDQFITATGGSPTYFSGSYDIETELSVIMKNYTTSLLTTTIPMTISESSSGTCDADTEVLCDGQCLSVSYATELNVGITPISTDSYSVIASDIQLSGYTRVTTDIDTDDMTFTCSTLTNYPVTYLMVYVYDVNSHCYIYQNEFGGDFGEAGTEQTAEPSKLKLPGIVLLIVGGSLVIVSALLFMFCRKRETKDCVELDKEISPEKLGKTKTPEQSV